MDYWKIILDIGSISWLLAFIYAVSQIFRKRPRFKFKKSWHQWKSFDNNWTEYYRFRILWMLKNQSLEPNSVNAIHSVVWWNKKTFSTLRHSTAVTQIISKTDNWKELKLPFLLNPHEWKDLEIILEFHVWKWSSDERILTQTKEVWKWFYVPKYEYELLFEDTNENIFDANWILCNMEESWLRWTIWNTIPSFKDWKYWEFISHSFKILKSKIKFRIKKILLYIWIY